MVRPLSIDIMDSHFNYEYLLKVRHLSATAAMSDVTNFEAVLVAMSNITYHLFIANTGPHYYSVRNDTEPVLLEGSVNYSFLKG